VHEAALSYYDRKVKDILQNIVADHSLRIMTSVMVSSFFLFLSSFLEPQDNLNMPPRITEFGPCGNLHGYNMRQPWTKQRPLDLSYVDAFRLDLLRDHTFV